MILQRYLTKLANFNIFLILIHPFLHCLIRYFDFFTKF